MTPPVWMWLILGGVVVYMAGFISAVVWIAKHPGDFGW